MLLAAGAVLDTANDLYENFQKGQNKRDRLLAYSRGNPQDKPSLPADAAPEHRVIRDQSVFDSVGLVLDTFTQQFSLSNYSDTPGGSSWGWSVWMANRGPVFEAALWRSAMTFGWSHIRVLPAEPVPQMTGVSARRALVLYAEDDTQMTGDPELALEVLSATRVKVYDDTNIYTCTRANSSGAFSDIVKAEGHDVGVVPFVPIPAPADLDGVIIGEVEPLIQPANRLNQALFDLAIVQSYGAFKVKYALGYMAANPAEAAKMAADRMLTFKAKPSDISVGTLEETPVDGYIKGVADALEKISIRAQIPVSRLTGTSSNVASESIALLEMSFYQKTDAYRRTFGDGIDRAFRLAAKIVGKTLSGTAAPQWRDMSARPFGATVDGLTKLGAADTGLDIPKEGLWRFIPGATESDFATWRAMRQSSAPTAREILLDGVRTRAD